MTNQRWSLGCGFQQNQSQWACRETVCTLQPQRGISPDWSLCEGQGCGCPIACRHSPWPTPKTEPDFHAKLPTERSLLLHNTLYAGFAGAVCYSNYACPYVCHTNNLWLGTNLVHDFTSGFPLYFAIEIQGLFQDFPALQHYLSRTNGRWSSYHVTIVTKILQYDWHIHDTFCEIKLCQWIMHHPIEYVILHNFNFVSYAKISNFIIPQMQIKPFVVCHTSANSIRWYYLLILLTKSAILHK